MSRLHALAAWPFGNNASMKVLSRAEPALQGNDFELIPTVRMESQHSIGTPTCHDFPRFVIILEKLRLEVGNRWRWSWFLGKKDPFRANFQKIIPKGFTTSQNHVLCANFVKFVWLEIGKVMRCLPDKKTKLPQGLLLSLLRGSRPKSARDSSKQYTRSSENFIQIRSLPVWSYSRTREHRWNAPQSISNTRRSFFVE